MAEPENCYTLRRCPTQRSARLAGRGAERLSEIAGRLGTAQTNLSRLLQQWLDASILRRELPFGESVRSSKKVLYRIQDPATRFWFRVYSPHRSLWRTYTPAQKRKLIHDHAATVFEDHCRERFPGAQRYWESGVELDLVAPDPDNDKGLLVAEVKWRPLFARGTQERAAPARKQMVALLSSQAVFAGPLCGARRPRCGGLIAVRRRGAGVNPSGSTVRLHQVSLGPQPVEGRAQAGDVALVG